MRPPLLPRPSSFKALTVSGEEAWSEANEDLLPDTWFNISRRGRSIKRQFREFLPQRLLVETDGSVCEQPTATSTTGWFVPMPFLTCLCCGVVYTRRDKDDFRKLARLSSEGRSTATTCRPLGSANELGGAAVTVVWAKAPLADKTKASGIAAT